MWQRLWGNLCRPAEAEKGVVAGPPKLLIVAVAAGMITGAMVAPAPTAPADAVAAIAAPAPPAHDHAGD